MWLRRRDHAIGSILRLSTAHANKNSLLPLLLLLFFGVHIDAPLTAFIFGVYGTLSLALSLSLYGRRVSQPI